MDMVQEVRRQFREIPGIMDYTAKPEYEKCVAISTKASIREMMMPGAIALITPLIVGFTFGPEVLGGLLAGVTVSGVLMGIFQSNAGGAWDNAKKSFEKGVLINGEMFYKKSEPHKASVTGDTVGDPFKDTSGPSMNILIKLMSIVSLVIAPYIAVVSSEGGNDGCGMKKECMMGGEGMMGGSCLGMKSKCDMTKCASMTKEECAKMCEEKGCSEMEKSYCMSMYNAEGKFVGPKCDMKECASMTKEECAKMCQEKGCSEMEKSYCMSMYNAEGKFIGPKCEMDKCMKMSKEECAAYCDSMKCSPDEKAMCMDHAGMNKGKKSCCKGGAESKPCGGEQRE
jgi:K(+)-stimulated pyrophosphate-energized sodium pump